LNQNTNQSSTLAEHWLILAIILLAALLRFLALDAQSLWGDEINIVSNATGAAPNRNGNAIIYVPILQSLMFLLGQSEFSLRLPAAFVGVLTVPLVYKTGEIFFDRDVGLIGAFLLSISVMHVNFSQEVHSYALFCFLSSLSLYWLWRALLTNKLLNWVAFGLAAGLNIPTHFYSFLVLFAEALIVLIVFLGRAWPWTALKNFQSVLTKRTVLNLAAALAVILLFTLPLLSRFITPQLSRLRNIQISTLEEVASLDGEQQSPDTRIKFEITQELIKKRAGELAHWTMEGNDFILYLYVSVLLIGLGYLLFRHPTEFLVACVWIILAPLLVALIARLAGFTFPSRRVIFVLPFAFLIVGVGLSALSRGLASLVGRVANRQVPIKSIALVLTGLLSVPSIIALNWYYTEWDKQDWRNAANLVEKFVQPGDVIVAHADKVYPQISHLGYYYSGPEGVLIFMPRDDLTLDLFQDYYANNDRIWYVRKIVDQDNLLEIEEWFRGENMLTFPYGGEGKAYEGIVVSYAYKTGDPERRLIEWLEILGQAIDLKPAKWSGDETLAEQYLQTHQALAQLYLKTGQYDRAISVWNQYLERHPESIDAHVGLAEVYLHMGANSEAIAMWDGYLERDPEDIVALSGLAEAYEANGQSDEAFAQLEKAIALDPSDGYIYTTLAHILHRRGDTEQALAAMIQQLEAIDPSVAHYAMALYYANAGQTEAAAREFQTVIDINPTHRVAKRAAELLDVIQ
jgi:tetratricopeptide (TPR) repeat protein